MMRWIRCVPVIPVILLSTMTGTALAQAWPSAKPLRLMVTQAAGSATDTVARYYADRLGKAIGQQIAVENRPGGANIPGLQAAARAAPDGYNFLIGTSVSFTTNVYLFKSLPYDPANDFVPLAMLTRPSFTVAVNAKLPPQNLAELAAYAKARPGKLTFAIDSQRNLNGIIAAYLNKLMGTDITLVPYTSTVQGMQDTAAGTTDAYIQTYGVMQGFVKKGDLRPIAVTSGTRASLLPDIATVAETYPGFQMTGWIAWFAPAGTPPETQQRVNRELDRILNEPETRDWAEHDEGPVDDAGARLEEVIKPYQVIHGLRGAPPVYGLIENARRGRLGSSKAAYAASMGALFAPFVPVAAANPYASAPVEAMSGHDLIDVTARNRMVADPYPVRLCARDQVNQGAALLMTSVGKARALGIAETRWIFVHGLATGTERDLIDRPDLSAVPSAVATIHAALDVAGRGITDIAHFDFYSCFPIAVFATAMDAMGIAPDDPRGLTVTGGLPFFGGPGNNYATHAVATMVERLRVRPGERGLVFANGGHMSKFGAIVLSSLPAAWREVTVIPPATAPAVAVDWHPTGPGHVLGYTVLYANGHPVRAVVIGDLDSGARFIANEADAETLAQCLSRDIVGARVAVSTAADGNRFTLT